MITESPTIRLHLEDEAFEESNKSLTIPGVSGIIEFFPQITGWDVDVLQPASQTISNLNELGMVSEWSTPPYSAAFPSLELGIVDMASDVGAGSSCSSRQKCDAFVESINHLVRQVQANQQQIESLNAELATAIPVSSADRGEDVVLAKLQSIIEQGLTALQLSAGGVYLLDDATRQLHLRVQVGLAENCFLQEPRRLKESMADLEALVGIPVAMADTSEVNNWNLPQLFPSALCVPVATHSTPLGTMWFFSETAREFTTSDIAVAELVGGRVSSELEREAAIREGAVTKKIGRDIERAKLWQQLQTPPVMPELESWDICGGQFLESGVGGAFYDYSIASSGNIVASVADIQGAVFESGLSAATMRGAMRTLDDRNLRPRQFLSQLNNTMWNCPLGDQIASLFQVQIEPETGIARWCNAGQTGALIVGLGSEAEIALESSPLGACEDEAYEERDRVLLPNSTLFAFNDGFRRLFKHKFRAADDFEIIQQLGDHELVLPKDIEAWISEMLMNYDSYRSAPDVSFLALHRKS